MAPIGSGQANFAGRSTRAIVLTVGQQAIARVRSSPVLDRCSRALNLLGDSACLGRGCHGRERGGGYG